MHNLGIFINLHKRGDEFYRLTHPAVNLGGFLRGTYGICGKCYFYSRLYLLGTLNLYVEDICYVTCPKTKLKAVLQYLGDSWIGKAKHKVEGVIYQYIQEDDGIQKIKDVPSKLVLAKIEGSWMSQLYYTVPGSNVSLFFILLGTLLVVLVLTLDESTGEAPIDRPGSSLSRAKDLPTTRRYASK